MKPEPKRGIGWEGPPVDLTELDEAVRRRFAGERGPRTVVLQRGTPYDDPPSDSGSSAACKATSRSPIRRQTGPDARPNQRISADCANSPLTCTWPGAKECAGPDGGLSGLSLRMLQNERGVVSPFGPKNLLLRFAAWVAARTGILTVGAGGRTILLPLHVNGRFLTGTGATATSGLRIFFHSCHINLHETLGL